MGCQSSQTLEKSHIFKTEFFIKATRIEPRGFFLKGFVCNPPNIERICNSKSRLNASFSGLESNF